MILRKLKDLAFLFVSTLVLLFSGLAFNVVGVAHAQNGAEPYQGNCEVENASTELNESNCGIVKLLNIIFNFVSGGVALAVIGNIIFAGIQYSTSQGDPSTAAKSKNRIRDAVLAFIMYVSLYAFVQWLIPGGVF